MAGGGDSAVEEALYLTKFARKVTLIHRRDELRAAKSIQEKAFANEKIAFLWNSTIVVSADGDGVLSSMTVKNTEDGRSHGNYRRRGRRHVRPVRISGLHPEFRAVRGRPPAGGRLYQDGRGHAHRYSRAFSPPAISASKACGRSSRRPPTAPSPRCRRRKYILRT